MKSIVSHIHLSWQFWPKVILYYLVLTTCTIVCIDYWIRFKNPNFTVCFVIIAYSHLSHGSSVLFLALLKTTGNFGITYQSVCSLFYPCWFQNVCKFCSWKSEKFTPSHKRNPQKKLVIAPQNKLFNSFIKY